MTITLFEMEKRLHPVLRQIAIEKNTALSNREVLWLTGQNLIEEAKKAPLTTTAKASLLFFAAGCLHPAFIGSIACVNGYRLENYNDLYSPNLSTAMDASQLFSNLGQGITFLIQGGRFFLFSFHLLSDQSYRAAKMSFLEKIYQKAIDETPLPESKQFLLRIRAFELSQSLPLPMATKEVDAEIKQALSPRNIIPLVMKESIKEAKQQPWTTLAKIFLVALTGLLLHPLILGTIGCLDSYRVENWNDIYSSDLAIAGEATNTFSNTGHVVEYLGGAFLLTALTVQCLFAKSHQTVTRREINAFFERYTTDFFYEMKLSELSRRGSSILPVDGETIPLPTDRSSSDSSPV